MQQKQLQEIKELTNLVIQAQDKFIKAKNAEIESHKDLVKNQSEIIKNKNELTWVLFIVLIVQTVIFISFLRV